MDRFKKSIDKQIEVSQGKNLFFNKSKIFHFISDTVKAISTINELNSEYELFLIDYATDKAINEFCRINQYYSFNTESKNELRKIYSNLLTDIRTQNYSTTELSEKHYNRIKNWLKKYNSFAEIVYNNSGPDIEPVTCSEYSPDLQFSILNIDLKNIIQPILDIGCGKRGNLVNYLISKGIEAYGIDRFTFTTPNLYTTDWLEYVYGIQKWGTIISNLGFSNHFIHHNFREDGNYIAYGKTYMNILYSLKTGGTFHYAPDLPFIEQYLDNNRFELKKTPINKSNFQATIIKRLK